jgi:hypothetical protein
MRADLASVGTYSVRAHLLSRRNDLEGAALAVEQTDAMLPRPTGAFWWLMTETRILLAPALVTLGRGADAATRLDEAAATLAEHPDSGRLVDGHHEPLRTLRLASRLEPSDELSGAKRRILRLLSSDLSLREIGRELYLSQNTVKTRSTRSTARSVCPGAPRPCASPGSGRRPCVAIHPGEPVRGARFSPGRALQSRHR